MKNPYFQGLQAGLEDISSRTVPMLLRESGGNTGNFFFTAAVQKVVSCAELRRGARFVPEEIRERHDGIIIPAANWVNQRAELGDLAALIEQADVPCVIVGLGAQSDRLENVPSLSPGTQRFLKVLSERSASLSVRGAFTAEVLSRYGVKNARVTGCPSLLWNGTDFRPVVKSADDVRTICVHTNRSHYLKRVFVSKNPVDILSRDFSRQAFRENWSYIAQSELPDMYFALGRSNEEDKFEENIGYLESVFDCNDRKVLIRYLSDRLKVFFKVEQWISFLAQHDVAVGTRIHGTIAALLAGTPGILIAHDTRTVELAEALNIPYVPVESLADQGPVDVQRLYDEVSYEKYNDGYREYYNRFVDFFHENGVTTNITAI